MLDRRLYLPQEWCTDVQRRTQAKVPEDVVFQSKPEQALLMLRHAWQVGVPMRWVTGDEIYGESAALRDAIADGGLWYVVGIRRRTTVFGEPTLAASPLALPVKAVVAGWPERQWQRLTIAAGEKGLITYDWAARRVIDSREGQAGPAVWLLARRSLSDPTDVAYFLSNAPADTPLLKLAQVACVRYTVEQCLQEAKSETGLDEYEVRHWHSWYRHITLSMMAHAWLAAVRLRANQKKGGPSPFWPS